MADPGASATPTVPRPSSPHFEGGLTMTNLARETGLSVSRVSRIIAEQERQ